MLSTFLSGMEVLNVALWTNPRAGVANIAQWPVAQDSMPIGAGFCNVLHRSCADVPIQRLNIKEAGKLKSPSSKQDSLPHSDANHPTQMPAKGLRHPQAPD